MIGGGGDGDGARRLLTTAEALLNAEDFIGSKKFALLAMESDPLLDGVDWIIAASEVLLSSNHRRVNHHPNWYQVLQLGTSETHDISSIRRHYRRLALLLRPQSRPSSRVADLAFQLVENAWKVLSDPLKKDLYDKELLLFSNPSAGENDPSCFWTICPNCCHIHQYRNGCQGRNLLCQNCRKPFPAKALQSAPPIVPGTDLYYCAWGLFPLGFAGDFNSANERWNPPISPFFPGESDRRSTQNGNAEDQARVTLGFKSPVGEPRKKVLVRRPTKHAADGGTGTGVDR